MNADVAIDKAEAFAIRVNERLRARWRARWLSAFKDASELGLIGLRETYATRAHARTLLELGILLDALTGDGPTQWRAAVEFAKASHGRCTLDIGRRSTRDLLVFFDADRYVLAHVLLDRGSPECVQVAGGVQVAGAFERRGRLSFWSVFDARGAMISTGSMTLDNHNVEIGQSFLFTIPIDEDEEVEITVHLDGPYYDTHDYRVGMGVATVDGRHWRVVGVDMLFDAVSHQTGSVRLKLRRDRTSERLQAAAEKNGYVAHQVDGERIKFRAAMRDDANARAPREDEELMRYVEPKPTPPEVRENVKAKKQQRSAIESAVRASVAQRIPPRRGFNAPRRR